MSKVDTDQGLGPGSERMRREVREAQDELESRSKQKAAPPVEVDKKDAVTEPGIGKVERKNDTVDALLDGFGPSRPDLPRILPNKDTTPPPEPVRKELTPTEPGKRQRTRNMVLATIVTFGAVVALGVVLVKMGSNSTAQPTPTPTVTTPATNTAQVSTAQPTEVAPPPITTMPIESLPTAKTATPPSTAKPVHSAPTSTTAATTTATTTTTTRPTGSAPPGMNLLPDDPHR